MDSAYSFRRSVLFQTEESLRLGLGKSTFSLLHVFAQHSRVSLVQPRSAQAAMCVELQTELSFE
jgi:hypothetical protein